MSLLMVRRRPPGSALALSGAPSRTIRKIEYHPSRRGEDAALRACEEYDLILRSLRSRRLEGWTQRTDSRPSFETRPRGRSSGRGLRDAAKAPLLQR